MYRISGQGWLPDPRDHRDLSVNSEVVQARLRRVLPTLSKGVAPAVGTPSPVGVLRADLRKWCSPIEDQQQLGSCTAHAIVGAMEYFERKTHGDHVDASRRFLYYVTRRYLQWEGDTGAFIRSAIKSLQLFGAPPERYWPYVSADYDVAPDAFVYAYAQNFKATEYFRLEESASQLKSALASGLPFAFGFTCFSSIDDEAVSKTGVIPYPSKKEQSVGGHAVLAVGYTDSHVLIRNSWGKGWGDHGYGYLPWSYFDRARPLADDCWALVNAAWVPDDEVDVEQMGAAAAAPVRRARGAKHAALAAPSARRFKPPTPPSIQVQRGTDPTRRVPMRLSATGVEAAAPAADAGLLVSSEKVALTLKTLSIDRSFDAFPKSVNELYVVAVVWDYSGRAPVVYPPEGVTPETAGQAFQMARAGETIAYVGDGLELWPKREIVGSLNVRLYVIEGDADVRKTGERLVKVADAVKGSAFAEGLIGLATGGTGAALVAVKQAATQLTGLIGEVLSDNEDDLCAVFEGSYGADHTFHDPSTPHAAEMVESYAQNGVTVQLGIRT